MGPDFIVIVAILLFLALPIMQIVTLVKLSGLQSELESLKRRLFRATKPEKTAPNPCASAEVACASAKRPPSAAVARPSSAVPTEPSALAVFWAKAADWLFVRGSFAPSGMSREFACATRWLVRLGMVLLVGSLAYFAKLSIDRGWMGPTGRVAATLVGGALGIAGGVVLVKRTRYAPIGHAVASLGVVALYFGFGLGHRFFDPPVIASEAFAFAALFAVTLGAGVISVYLSLGDNGRARAGRRLSGAGCGGTRFGVPAGTRRLSPHAQRRGVRRGASSFVVGSRLSRSDARHGRRLRLERFAPRRRI